jgi:hypothetical protein
VARALANIARGKRRSPLPLQTTTPPTQLAGDARTTAASNIHGTACIFFGDTVEEAWERLICSSRFRAKKALTRMAEEGCNKDSWPCRSCRWLLEGLLCDFHGVASCGMSLFCSVDYLWYLSRSRQSPFCHIRELGTHYSIGVGADTS